MSVALEKIFTQDSFKRDSTLFTGVTLNYLLFNGCVNLLQRVKETVNGEKQNSHVFKCQFQQLLVYFLSKTKCLLLTIEVRATYVDRNHIHHIACEIEQCTKQLLPFLCKRTFLLMTIYYKMY